MRYKNLDFVGIRLRDLTLYNGLYSVIEKL